MKKQTSIFIGTSGWEYKHWKNVFYPKNITGKEHLEYYAKYFSTVEVNNSFYHLLNNKVVNNWINSTPEDFVFAVKASRYITQMKKLKEPKASTEKFFESIKPFGEKIGPILFQLPPNFGFNGQRLEEFIVTCVTQNKTCSKETPDYKYVFEFRNPSWYNEKTYEILNRYNCAFCIYNLGTTQTPKEITADFVYMRFHGNYGLGSGKYSTKELEGFAQDINNFTSKGKDVYCYFNNDEAGFAVENAIELRKRVS